MRLLIREFKSFFGWVGSGVGVLWLALTDNIGQGPAAIVGLLVGLIIYRIEVLLIPETNCPSCKGSPRIRNAWWDKRHSRPCSYCGGRGRVYRLGARVPDDE